METPLITLHAQYNKHNSSTCELYPDRVVLITRCTGGLLPVYANKTREIPLEEISRVIISNGGTGYFASHPNAIHFVVRGATRTLDDMFRDRRFTSASYIDEGVQQFCAKNQSDLAEKIGVAARIKDYIERTQSGAGENGGIQPKREAAPGMI